MKIFPLVANAAKLWSATPTRLIDEASLDKNPRHVVFEADTDDGFQVVIKATMDLAQAVQLENEVRANLFMGRVLDSEMFRVPRPFGEPRRSGSLSAAAFEFVQTDWFATKFPKMHLLREMTDADLICTLSLMEELHGEDHVPQFFLDRAAKEFTDQRIRDRLREYLMPVLQAGHITDVEANGLIALACDGPIVRRFVHHDIVPWNMGRDRENHLVLVDSEYARWGMAFYDLAYFFLQTRIMLGDAKLAQRCLTMALGEDGYANGFESSLLQPLAYRLGANLHEALKRPDQMKIARALIAPVLAQDFDAILAV